MVLFTRVIVTTYRCFRLRVPRHIHADVCVCQKNYETGLPIGFCISREADNLGSILIIADSRFMAVWRNKSGNRKLCMVISCL